MLIDIQKRLPGAVKRCALIVEDDPHLQQAMRKVLGRMDFDVLTADHYDAAVLHLAARVFQVACIDVQLPGKSGYELCEHVRATFGAALPILMTSEYGSPGDMAYAEDAGGNQFLRKPFSMRALVGCVESLLAPTPRRSWGMHYLLPVGSRSKPVVHVAERATRPPELVAA
jgi:DNA-binding response OmpR family regulator